MLAPTGVKIAGVRGQFGGGAVHDVGITGHQAPQFIARLQRAVIDQFHAGRFAERHGEISVEAAANIDEGGVDHVPRAVGVAEEIHQRAIHAGGGFAVPVDAQEQIAIEAFVRG